MKFMDEYRDSRKTGGYARLISNITTRRWRIMEICGGQTHAIIRFGIDQLLPKSVELVHGPGCPVCVTPIELIDKAVEIAARKNVIFCSFGDMLRVPGSQKDLFSVKARGADIRVVYSPMDALKLAVENPQREVVFFAVGFETTAPANAMAVYEASRKKLKNFSILVSHVLVPPAIEAILSSKDNHVRGFLAAGHVCTVMGWTEYEPLARKYKVPIVVTGFEPLDILEGIYRCIKQLEEGRFEVENAYARCVKKQGNVPAQRLIKEIFQIIPRKWRGVGEIPRSGLGLKGRYSEWDAEKRFKIENYKADESPECIGGQILQGIKKPYDCPAFGKRCTPEKPLGATMVSSEGACSAYYRYRDYQLALHTAGERAV